MELSQVIEFIKALSPEDKAIVRAELKTNQPRITIKELCSKDIGELLKVLPYTKDEYKSYRYDTTSVVYLNYIRELANMIAHNYVCRQNSRGYPVWKGAEDVAVSRSKEYQAVYSTLAQTIITMMNQAGTTYTHPDDP